MIAQPLPEYEELRAVRRARTARAAALRRRTVRVRSRYAVLARIVASVSVVTLAVGIYLALLANVTRLNYELSKNLRTQARLADESARLDDEIARLGSRERLARLAAKLGMHDADTLAAVSLPAPAPATTTGGGLAFLSWLK